MNKFEAITLMYEDKAKIRSMNWPTGKYIRLSQFGAIIYQDNSPTSITHLRDKSSWEIYDSAFIDSDIQPGLKVCLSKQFTSTYQFITTRINGQIIWLMVNVEKSFVGKKFNNASEVVKYLNKNHFSKAA